MSNELAIAAVTRTLRNLLNAIATADFSELPEDTRPTSEVRITTLPLDRVRNGNGNEAGNQVNLFLYHTEPSAAWRNMDLPRKVRPGETAHPALALNLNYIVTAYGQDDSELVAHVLLGTAMSIFHDHPVLSRQEIRDALAASELDIQIERVKVTPQPVPLDDISKLWTGFQSEYRLSAAYQASVVLIESKRASSAPLPVLRRGSEDRGPVATASASPSLERVAEIFDPDLEVRPVAGKASAELGDRLVISGSHLDQEGLTALFRHRLLQDPIQRLPESSGTKASELRVTLPDQAEDAATASAWPAGTYTVSVRVQRPGLPAWVSNRVPFSLAPTVTNIALEESAKLTLTCLPQRRPEQQVSLLLGHHEVPLDSDETPPNNAEAASTLVFAVDSVPAGQYVVRLRVDGIDSIPVDFTSTPPAFDDNQKVTLSDE
ncbi:MAG TPA: DUF4255 domain-containing protein [Acidobacteriota bacterium]|nr:DUF4255 domain-containing protein [Acidobacteriota bacterium]